VNHCAGGPDRLEIIASSAKIVGGNRELSAAKSRASLESCPQRATLRTGLELDREADCCGQLSLPCDLMRTALSWLDSWQDQGLMNRRTLADSVYYKKTASTLLIQFKTLLNNVHRFESIVFHSVRFRAVGDKVRIIGEITPRVSSRFRVRVTLRRFLGEHSEGSHRKGDCEWILVVFCLCSSMVGAVFGLSTFSVGPRRTPPNPVSREEVGAQQRHRRGNRPANQSVHEKVPTFASPSNCCKSLYFLNLRSFPHQNSTLTNSGKESK